jgi:MFS family permease
MRGTWAVASAIEGRSGFYGWKNAILLFGIYMSALGFVFYGFSVIFPTMIKSMDWNRGTASIAHTISVLLMGLMVPLVAISINKLGAKRTISLGLSLLLVGLLLLGTVTSQIWHWIIIWGIVIGVGFAFCGVLPIQTTVMHWFNVKRATAMGIVMTGAAAGGFAAQPYYTWLMGVADEWRFGWLNGAVFVFIGLVCSLFLVNRPEDIGQHPDGLSPDEIEATQSQAGGGARTYRTAKTWEVKQVFGTPIIYFITIVLIGHLMSLFLITSHGVLHFTDMGFSQMQAASILSLIILGSGFARFPAGWLADRIEPRWILTVTLGIMLAVYFGIWKSTNLDMVMISGAVFGFCYGCQLIMFPTIIGNYYGPEIFPNINGIIAPFLILFGAVVPVGAGYVFEKYGSYDAAFVVMIIMLAVSLIFSLLLTPPGLTEATSEGQL